MSEQAFRILGIEPTNDARTIHAAFRRLARIYHPDRFNDMPADVRAEAERRMKDVTAAYETLREPRQDVSTSASGVAPGELEERARQYLATIQAKQVEERRDRARWRRWDKLEQQARRRMELEADIAASVAQDVNGDQDSPSIQLGPVPHPTSRPRPSVGQAAKAQTNGVAKSRPSLDQRLDAARRGETAPLVPRNTP